MNKLGGVTWDIWGLIFHRLSEDKVIYDRDLHWLASCQCIWRKERRAITNKFGSEENQFLDCHLMLNEYVDRSDVIPHFYSQSRTSNRTYDVRNVIDYRNTKYFQPSHYITIPVIFDSHDCLSLIKMSI